jgi:hypothetical protein
MIDEGYKVPAIATALDRSKASIMARKSKLGVSLRTRDLGLALAPPNGPPSLTPPDANRLTNRDDGKRQIMSRNDGVTTAERAFQLARSGTCQTISEISRQLNREGFEMVQSHLGGGSIKAQLNKLLSEGREEGYVRGSRR